MRQLSKLVGSYWTQLLLKGEVRARRAERRKSSAKEGIIDYKIRIQRPDL